MVTADDLDYDTGILLSWLDCKVRYVAFKLERMRATAKLITWFAGRGIHEASTAGIMSLRLSVGRGTAFFSQCVYDLTLI